MLNEENWMARDDAFREEGLVQVRDADVKLGGHYEYRGRTAITPYLTYDATVIKITRHMFILNLKAKKDIDSLGETLPYSFAIPRMELGRTERLYRRVGNDNTTT